MKTIVLEVSEPAAEKLSKMTPSERKAISDKIDRMISNRKSLEDILKEASDQARKNGLTPESLEDLLNQS